MRQGFPRIEEFAEKRAKRYNEGRFMRKKISLNWPIPSSRFAFYFGAISLLWIAAAFTREFVVVAALCNVLLLFLALMDLLVSPRTRDFEVERTLSDKMNLGVANKVSLSVHSRAPVAMKVWVRDEPPVHWPVTGTEDASTRANANLAEKVAPPVARLLLPTQPGRTTRDEYSITPTRRGEWLWGALSFRFQTRLGLWHRQARLAPAAGEELRVRVFPDTSEVHRYELSLREGRLRDIGLHLQRLRGKGSEFESLREYTLGDDYKDINWKASARRGKLISTNYDIERDQTVIVAIDCGRMMTSMAVTRSSHSTKGRDLNSIEYSNVATEELITPLSKLDCAINAAVLLAHVSASMGDAVGVLLFADTVLGFVPPRKGRLQTGKIIDAMYAVQPRLVEPDYISAYNYLLARKVRRSLVVTFTDLIDAEASRELLQASGALRRHHNALCVTINNRDVTEMAHVLPQNSDELYSKAMAQRMLNGRLSALENLRRQGVGVLDTEASALTIATVNRYLDLKARGAL